MPQLASQLYWTVNDERAIQKQYVALCLLLAAVQDAVMGQAELVHRNLNWSATISYYSLVHSGRLIAFAALGDYPTMHLDLRKFFKNQPVRLNWLKQHCDLAGQRYSFQPPIDGQAAAAGLEVHGVLDATGRFMYFGEVLDAAAQVRNDSNYEALLVAHEYDHQMVTRSFEDLAAAMGLAAQRGLELAIDAFNALRTASRENSQQAEGFEALLHEYLHGRIIPALQEKVGSLEQSVNLLNIVGQRLQTDPTARRNMVLEQSLLMTFFTGKTKLMERFRERIDDLRDALTRLDSHRAAQ